MEFSRRNFLGGMAGVAALGTGLTALGAAPAWAEARPDGKVIHPETALSYLKKGNARWVAGKKNPAAIKRLSFAPKGVAIDEGQWPIAAIVSCADSRVQPDELFDLAPANLFVIRNAGNVIDDDVLGSLEYGVEHLGITLIVTLGHSLCGAVKATEAVVAGGAMPGHHVDALVNHIKPALTALPAGHTLAQAVTANAKQSASLAASESDVVAEFVAQGELKVVAATYDLVSRKVTFA